MLSIMFTLPSPKTLQNVLSSVSITTGVSPIVMKVLKEKAEKLKPLERFLKSHYNQHLYSKIIKLYIHLDIVH